MTAGKTSMGYDHFATPFAWLLDKKLLLYPIFFLTLAVPVANTANAQMSEYDSRLQRAVGRCEQLDPKEYSTWLIFNPDGYRSFYARSDCFQQVAERLRASELCTRVKQRYSLFSSSWGISEENCRALVAAKQSQDHSDLAEIRRAYLAGPLRPTGLRMELNGNGRDYDFVAAFAGDHAGTYDLIIAIVKPQGSSHPILERSGHISAEHNLRLYLPRAKLLQRFPDLEFGKRYLLQAHLVLSISRIRVDGMMNEAFIEAEFPVARRTQQLQVEAVF